MSSYAERAGAPAIAKPSGVGSTKPPVSAASIAAASNPKSSKPASASVTSVPPTTTSSKPARKGDVLDDIFSDAPIAPKTRVTGVGRVKDVMSASTIIVAGANNKEKRLVLSGVNAPRLGFGKNGADEPFAFQAKEFARALLLGQKVTFTLLNGNSDKEGALEHAEVFLDGVNVAHTIVAAGWAKVVIPKSRKEATEPEAPAAAPAATGKKGKAAAAAPAPAPAEEKVDIDSLPVERQQLYKLQLAAQKGKVGMFKPTSGATVRTVDWAPSHLAWIKAHKDQPLAATVDRVLDGTTLRLEVANPTAPESLKNTMLTVSVAGALAPRMPLSTDKNATVPAGAAEAVAYVEQRLAHRDVTLTLKGIDKAGPAAGAQGTLYGTIHHPKGNIAVRLLEAKLAKYVPWTAALLDDSERAALQEAAGVTAGASAKAGEPFTATVVQIVSGDMIVVKNEEGEHKLALASVSAPRSSRVKPEAFAFEAKEFLRKSLIGKTVTVVPEYTRELKPSPAAAATPEGEAEASPVAAEVRQYVTVYKGKYNVAIELVAAGLADVVGYAKDADRPASYAELCQAEAAAIAGEKGKHSKKAAPAQVQDYTRVAPGKAAKAADKADAHKANKANADRLQLALTKLTAQQYVHGVVEAVFTPNLIKVFVPLLHAYIPVSFSAIAGPRSRKADAETEEEAKEAATKAKACADASIAHLKTLLQQDVTLEVTALSRQDAFLANVLVGAAGNKESVAVSLVKQGVASLIPPVADRNAYKKQLQSAEAEAKRKKIGIWVDYDEAKERAEADKARTEAAQALLGSGVYAKDGVQYVNAVVTDVADPVHFYINSVDDANVAVVKAKMDEFVPADAPEGFKPRKDDIVAGLFEDDKKWYRVRIDAFSAKSGLYSVQFIDFGNVTALPLADLRPLPKDLASIRALARPCKLSALKPPMANTDHFEGAANAFAAMTAGATFAARVDGADPAPGPGLPQVLHLTLFATEANAEGETPSVNGELLKSGWVRVNTRPARRLEGLVAELEQLEAIGRAGRHNIWEYGSYGTDSDE